MTVEHLIEYLRARGAVVEVVDEEVASDLGLPLYIATLDGRSTPLPLRRNFPISPRHARDLCQRLGLPVPSNWAVVM
ncbi:MAG: hypothetical protein F2534_03475 [Actinobacteria bacterium]|nr:hypothetical protein [Actinomycetota bacterium]